MILVILQSLHLLQISKIKRPLLRIKKKKKEIAFAIFEHSSFLNEPIQTGFRQIGTIFSL